MNEIIVIVIVIALALFLIMIKPRVDRRNIDIAIPDHLEDKCSVLEADLDRISNEILEIRALISELKSKGCDIATDRRNGGDA